MHWFEGKVRIEDEDVVIISSKNISTTTRPTKSYVLIPLVHYKNPLYFLAMPTLQMKINDRSGIIFLFNFFTSFRFPAIEDVH